MIKNKTASKGVSKPAKKSTTAPKALSSKKAPKKAVAKPAAAKAAEVKQTIAASPAPKKKPEPPKEVPQAAAKAAPKEAPKTATTAKKAAVPHRKLGDRPVFAPGTANPYLPQMATVQEAIQETHNIMTFRVTFDDPKAMEKFHFEPGQVGQLSAFGIGESTFVINSPPTRKEYLQFSVMRTGENTSALHAVKAGDKVGVRAPLGNHFPYESMKGKDIVFVGGGIGMAPLRTLLLFMLDTRKDYGKISLLYGARSPQDMAFSYELPEWLERDDLECVLTIDREAKDWPHKVGLIPNVLLEMNPSPKNTVAITCGPPIMIKFTVEALKKLGFADENIMTTLEKRMKCGIGICGRCNIGTKYVCVDGPVFSYADLKNIPNEM